MKKKIIILVILLLLVLSGGLGYYYFLMQNSADNALTFLVPEVLEPFVRIEKNEEMSSSNLSLNGQNNEMYYFFDIYNYDEISQEYSTLDITPYVKIAIKQTDASEDEGESFVNVSLYSIKNLELGMQEDNLEEITEKGEAGSGYENYYKCKRLYKYDENKNDNNVMHYVAKITLDTEAEEYNNLTENIAQKLEIILGYRK